MRVFVAGASGAIGRPLVRKLVAAGHEVTGMTRSAERGEEITAAGASAVVCDVFDAAALGAAVGDSRPEAVIHQLTALPEVFDFRRRDLYDATNRLRTEGTANLMAAARAVGARRFIAQSISFVYEPEGGWVKEEDAPMMRSAPVPFDGALAALSELEAAVLGATDLAGFVLRYGFFYGPGTAYAADAYYANEVRRRRFPIVGKGTGTFSFVHTEDAAAATLAALEAPASAAGLYNVTDDEPAAMTEWVPVFAAELGAPKPMRVPRWLAALVAGRIVADMAITLRGASNAKARAELGWQPSRPSWREGFAELGK